MRMTLTAALKPEAQSDGRAESTPLAGERFHIVIGVEEVWTGDGRFWKAGSFAWRDLPLPMMATDKTTFDHLDARLVGNIDTIERIGPEIHGWGSYIDAATLGDDDDAREVQRLQRLMQTGRLPGVSADMDDPEYEVIIPGEQMTFDEENDLLEEGDGDVRIPVTEMIRTEFSHVRILGATALPFPANDRPVGVILDEAPEADDVIEVTDDDTEALAASGHGWVDACTCDTVKPTKPLAEWCPNRDVVPFGPSAIVAAVATPRRTDDRPVIEPPTLPPLAWFRNPELKAATSSTITDEGQMFGHLAAWGSCHIGFADKCVTPPRSATSYAYFHTGELITAEGERVSVGKLTIGAGHAPIHLTAGPAVGHYDNATWAFADVVVGEDDYGIWFAGALRPDLSSSSLRMIMASELSGDWRKIGRGLELVAALAVNVPGFARPRAAVAMRDGMVASLVASLPVIERTRDGRRRLPDPVARYAVERIAASVGRSTKQRIAEQVARVKEGR
jgi:hypothetical protein